MIEKVISGAQTGADIGGLLAAKLYGLETGGNIPFGGRCHIANECRWLIDLFNLTENPSPDYVPRTLLNAEESDGTLRLAVDFSTAGEKCTLRGIKQAGKPNFDVQIDRASPIIKNTEVVRFTKWLIDNDIKILNVAGNSHKTWGGMQPYTVQFLSATFTYLGFDRRAIGPEFARLAMKSYS